MSDFDFKNYSTQAERHAITVAETGNPADPNSKRRKP
jgi:hypothetical protein